MAEELDVHTLNLNSTPAELLILGSENRLVRFSVSDCHPLWVVPVNTEVVQRGPVDVYVRTVDICRVAPVG